MATKNEQTAASAELTVRVKIPKTKELQDDVFVSVNNRTWQIQRGVYVEVPVCVAEVLQHSEEMSEEALRFEAQVQSKDN